MSYTKQNFVDGDVLTAKALNLMDEQIAKNDTNKVNLPTDEEGNLLYGKAGQVLISKGDGTVEWLEAEEEAPEGSLPFEKTAKLVQHKPIVGTKLKCTSIIAPTATGVSSITITRCGKNLVEVQDGTTFPQGTAFVDALKFFGDSGLYLTCQVYLELVGAEANIRYSYTNNGKNIGEQGVIIADGESGISYVTMGNANGESGCPPSATSAFFGFRRGAATTKFNYSNFQVEVGTSATAFEEYQGDTYTINLGRTVYGGKFNWATGELTITHDLVGGAVVEKETPETVEFEAKNIYALATASGINTIYSDCGQTTVSGYISGGSVGEITNSENIVTLKYSDKRLLALGDSITNAGKYLKSLQSYVPFKGIDNQGIGGATMLRRGQDSDCCLLIDSLETNVTNADVITIAYGTNDAGYLAGAYQLGEIAASGSEFDKTSFIGAYQYTIEKILTWKPTVKIILVVPAYAMTTGDKATKDAMTQAIRDIANFYALEYVDLYYKSGMNAFNVGTLENPIYTWDGLHPSDIFGDITAKKFIPILLY